jgi:quercetin dioxygenase-like cupin family protein
VHDRLGHCAGGRVSDWPWPDELDALAAAPEHHRALFENDAVRVLETHIPAGAQTAVHTHRWPNVQHVLSTTDFVRRDGDGAVVFDTRAGAHRPDPGETLWSEPLAPHSIENVGSAELRVLMVELKQGGNA